MLRKIAFSLISVMLLCAGECEVAPTLVGKYDVITITEPKIILESTVVEYPKMIATGTIRNTGKTTIYPPWFVEGFFYTDNSYDDKMGGASTSFGFSLGPNEQTRWVLNFSTSLYDVREYPDFMVSGLRAYHEPD